MPVGSGLYILGIGLFFKSVGSGSISKVGFRARYVLAARTLIESFT